MIDRSEAEKKVIPLLFISLDFFYLLRAYMRYTCMRTSDFLANSASIDEPPCLSLFQILNLSSDLQSRFVVVGTQLYYSKGYRSKRISLMYGVILGKKKILLEKNELPLFIWDCTFFIYTNTHTDTRLSDIIRFIVNHK